MVFLTLYLLVQVALIAKYDAKILNYDAKILTP